jgi:chromosome segregation ATPase
MKKTFVIAALLLMPSFLFADDNVGAQLDKLKTNADNAEFNRKEYEKNLDIVDKNVKEIDKAMDGLKKNKEDVRKQIANSAENKKNLEKQKGQLNGLVTKEEKSIADEQKKIDALMAKINELKANQDKRSKNVAAYQEKVKEIDAEFADWDNQQKKIAELDGLIDKKTADAGKEKQAWLEKKRSYDIQVKKWKDEEAKASRESKNYNKLNN